MKRNLLRLGLPIVAGLSFALVSCGNPAVEREEGELQQPGAVPTTVDEDEDDENENVPGQGINNEDDENENGGDDN